MIIPPGNCPNPAFYAKIRKTVANAKAGEPALVGRQVRCHQVAVAEYSRSMLTHLVKSEKTSTRPNINCFKAQPHINNKMRYMIFDFVMCCHTRLNLCQSSLFLAFDILNRYSCKYIIKCSDYQLHALTALWISAKYWDSKNKIPSFRTLVSLCCHQYTPSNFRDVEWHLLSALNWSLSETPTQDSFVDMLLTVKNKNKVFEPFKTVDLAEIRLGAIMLCELASFNAGISINLNSSTTAVAAMTLVSLSLNFHYHKKWENFRLGFRDPALIKVCTMLLEMVVYTRTLPSSFMFKYLNEKSDVTTVELVTTSERIINALIKYMKKLEMEEFYSSEEYKLAETLENSTQQQQQQPEESAGTISNSHISNGVDAGTHHNSSTEEGTHSDIHDNRQYSISSSSFASPNKVDELVASTTPDSIDAERLKLLLPNVSGSAMFANQVFLLPLTPTTPTNGFPPSQQQEQSRQQQQFFENKQSILTATRARMPSVASSTTTASSINTATAAADSTSAAIEPTNGHTRGHRKRSSSTMDIDFFEDDQTAKRAFPDSKDFKGA